MADSELRKTKHVLLIVGFEGPNLTDHVQFRSPHAEGDNPLDDVFLNVPNIYWVEMGQPNVVTITIEPGDRLNPENDDDPMVVNMINGEVYDGEAASEANEDEG